jgi:hypothetical protein
MLAVIHLLPVQCWSSGRLALQVTVWGLAQYEPIAARCGQTLPSQDRPDGVAGWNT